MANNNNETQKKPIEATIFGLSIPIIIVVGILSIIIYPKIVHK